MELTRLAGGIILSEDHHLFLMHRTSQGKNQWETPGGKVEFGETDEAAALRELKEELGLKLSWTEKLVKQILLKMRKNFTMFGS